MCLGCGGGRLEQSGGWGERPPNSVKAESGREVVGLGDSDTRLGHTCQNPSAVPFVSVHFPVIRAQ